MSRPYISIMMPCYNASESLPWALASLLAQSFEDWELVLVDDGSTDRPEEIVAQVADPRIRLIRLPENRGRGYARQVALDNARGEFIAMLDADDWMYPSRLEREIEMLRHEPSLALVSAGMAIANEKRELVGVRSVGDGVVRGPHQGVICPVAHAPSMYRRSLVGDLSFDLSLRMSEDQDFLLRLLQGQHFVILPEPLYVYAELGSVSARKAALGQRYSRVTLRKYYRAYPAEVVRGLAVSSAKELAYTIGAALHLDTHMIKRRSRTPTELERHMFADARRKVEQTACRHFGIHETDRSLTNSKEIPSPSH